MKLLVDCTTLNAGGGIQVALAFLQNLRARADIEWQAVASCQLLPLFPKEMVSDQRITFLPKSNMVDIALAGLKLRRIERAFAPDAVFTVFGPAYFRAHAPHLVGFALPNLIYESDEILARETGLARKTADWLRCVLLRRADHLVVETGTVRSRLAQRLGIPPDRISVIGNCVNPLLASLPTHEPPPAGRYVLLIPSTYYPHKNLEIVPSVAAALQRLDPGFDFEFRFTLESGSAPWQAILAAAKQISVSARLVTLGPLRLDQLAWAYNAASAVFIPTLREASTAVYPESFHFRRPLVTSDLDFARELCGDAALFVSPLAPGAIAAQLLAMARSPEMAARLVAAGERRLASRYPTPDRKYSLQMDLLASMARQRSEVPGQFVP